MKKLFTPEFVASLQPQATRYEVFDKQLAGFAVRVSTNGRLVWYVQKRYTAADLTSKVHKEVLGDTTSMSLDDARARALEVITGLQTIPKCLPAVVQPRITVATLYDTYLQCSSPQASLRFTTIADYTFVLNRVKKVKASAGTDTRTLRPDTAYLYVAFASKDLSYKVTIDSVSAPTSAESNDTSGTAGRITTQINVSMAGKYEAKHLNNSSVIRIKSVDGSALPKIKVSDGYADQALFVIQDEVARFSDLPPLCEEGFVVSVTGDPETDNDQYWVEYKNGRWQECLKPELVDNAFDAHSMPHVLVRQSDGNFYFHPAAWAERLVGDKESNPAPTFVGRKINDVFYFRNRLGFLSDENVILSRAGKPFMFWRESATMLLDSDPIDISVSSTRVSTLYHAVPFNKELVLFSDQAQFIMTAQQTLTPKTASITEATGFAASRGCKPQQFGPNLVFPVEREDFAAMREYYTSSDSAMNNAVDLSAHVPALIPKGVTKISTSTHEDMLVTMTEAAPSKLFVYKSFWNGQEKVQSAWSYWDFGVGTQINGFEFIGSRLYVVLTRADGAFIERIDMSQQDVDGALPFKVSVDRRHLAVGAYNVQLDETAFEVPYLDDALMGVVMFSTFSMTAESVIKAAAEDLERDYSATMHIRVQLLKDARVIAECPLTVDNECMSSYKRIIKMLVDNKLIRAERARMFTVEECPEGREAMIFLNIKREKIPVMIIAT